MKFSIQIQAPTCMQNSVTHRRVSVYLVHLLTGHRLELEPFDFINQFPAEVRNMIYRWTWILSRKRPEDEGIPDFYVKPDLEYRNSRLPPKIATVRWENIHGFPLLRLNQQLRSEVLPIIAKETHFELRVYQQEYDKDLSFFGGHIEKVPLLRDAGKITIHQTDIDGSYVWWINLLIEQIACNKRLKILIVSHTIFITTKYEFDQIPRDFQEVCRLLREMPDLGLRVHLRRGPVIWLRLDEDDEDADVEVSGGYILPIMMEEIEKWFIQLAATLGVSDEKVSILR